MLMKNSSNIYFITEILKMYAVDLNDTENLNLISQSFYANYRNNYSHNVKAN